MVKERGGLFLLLEVISCYHIIAVLNTHFIAHQSSDNHFREYFIDYTLDISNISIVEKVLGKV